VRKREKKGCRRVDGHEERKVGVDLSFLYPKRRGNKTDPHRKQPCEGKRWSPRKEEISETEVRKWLGAPP